MSIKTFNKQRGTSLLEVLIAAVIVAVGLLGIASLQLKSIQSSSNAQYRAIATDIAWSMADRMRANLAGDNDYSNVIANCAAPTQSCNMIPTATNAASTDSCSAAQIATYASYVPLAANLNYLAALSASAPVSMPRLVMVITALHTQPLKSESLGLRVPIMTAPENSKMK